MAERPKGYGMTAEVSDVIDSKYDVERGETVHYLQKNWKATIYRNI